MPCAASLGQVIVLMLSSTYFTSTACVNELRAACRTHKPIIPIYLEDVDIDTPFLGTTSSQIKAANFIRQRIAGNRVPPPNEGFFQGESAADFKRNMKKLVDAIQEHIQ